MIYIKTAEEIEIMKHGGRILHDVLFQVLEQIKPGVTEIEIDRLAEQLIREKGGEPGFKKVPGYNHTVCMSTNDVVVHGIPGNYSFQEGDIVGVDCGVYYKGFHTDMSETIRVSTTNKNRHSGERQRLQNPDSGQARMTDKSEIDKFLETGKRALEEAIKVAVPGNRIWHISKKIQDTVEKEAGYSIVRSLIGHGVGKELHEEPEVPGYVHLPINKTPLLKEGMTIAIEVIYNMGKQDVVLDRDGWTIRTKDGKVSGLYERTVAITKNGNMVLT